MFSVKVCDNTRHGTACKAQAHTHSVDVDEENLEYIKAKQKQQQKFKNRLESIFEKFGNMNPSQSDEIDFNTNRVVVDRGHLRRIKRQTNGKEKTLLETIVMGAGSRLEDGGSDEEKAEGEDSADELAPPQLVKSRTAGPSEQDTSKRPTEATKANAQQSVLLQPNIPATSIPQFSVPQTPRAPSPTAELLRHVQFPQTPAGQQAQSAFHANLLQTINQAVHQAVAGLILPNAPTTLANAAPAPATSLTTDDKVAPATDPKWFFPPLSAKQRQFPVAQSSPILSHALASIAKQAVQPHEDTTPTEVTEERSIMAMHARPGESSPTRPRRTSPRVEIQRRIPRTARKYHFTHEDDVYISKRKKIDGVSWAVIKDGQSKWKEWPMSALHSRWNLINNKGLHLQEPCVAPTGGRVDGGNHVFTEPIPAASKTPYHLPTPSSSEHEECHQGFAEPTEEGIQNLLSSSTHYDDDDRDLLSLAGNDSDEDELPIHNDDDDAIGNLSQDVILPSIETRDSVHEDTVQDDLLANPPTQDTVATPTRQSSCTAVKTEPAFSSPTFILTTRKRSPFIPNVIPDSQEDQNDMQDDDLASIPASPSRNTDDKTPSKIAKPLASQQTAQQNPHTTSRHKSPSLDLINTSAANDELLPSPPNPTTPSLKRKHSSTTPQTAFLSTSYQTPKPRNVAHGSEKGSKSTSKVDRKAFHKRIKREWTRKGTPAKDSVAGKRRSLGGLEVRKRRWVDVDGDVDIDGSEDELAVF